MRGDLYMAKNSQPSYYTPNIKDALILDTYEKIVQFRNPLNESVIRLVAEKEIEIPLHDEFSSEEIKFGLEMYLDLMPEGVVPISWKQLNLGFLKGLLFRHSINPFIKLHIQSEMYQLASKIKEPFNKWDCPFDFMILFEEKEIKLVEGIFCPGLQYEKNNNIVICYVNWEDPMNWTPETSTMYMVNFLNTVGESVSLYSGDNSEWAFLTFKTAMDTLKSIIYEND